MDNPAKNLRMADHVRRVNALSYHEAYELIAKEIDQESAREETPVYPSLSSGKVATIEKA